MVAGSSGHGDVLRQRTLGLKLIGAVRTIRAAIPVMLTAGGGVIVNIGSLNAWLPDPAVLDDSAAKAALVNLAKSLSKEFGPARIRVNTVDPAAWSRRSDPARGQPGVTPAASGGLRRRSQVQALDSRHE